MLDDQVESSTLAREKPLESLREPLRRISRFAELAEAVGPEERKELRRAEELRARWSPYHHLNLSPVEWTQLLLSCNLSERTRRKMQAEREGERGARRRGVSGKEHYMVKRKRMRELKRASRARRGPDETTLSKFYKRLLRNWRQAGAREWMSYREFEQLANKIPLVDEEPFYLNKERRVALKRVDSKRGFTIENVEVYIDRELVVRASSI